MIASPMVHRRRQWAASAFSVLVMTWLSACGRGEPPATGTQPAPTARFACGAPATAIHHLERNASLIRQRLNPKIVEIEGVVVGNFQGGLGGFFVQTAPGEDDGNPETPEGLFVEHRSEQPPPRLGQRLRLRGAWSTIDDPARGELALRRVERMLDCGSAPLPEAIEVQQPPASWASLAGMRVRLPGPMALTGNDNLLRFGELWLSFDSRLVAPTEQEPPGAQARALAERNQHRLIIVDDGRLSQYPREIWTLPEPPSAQTPYRAGSFVYGVDAVVDYRFDGWRLQATRPVERVEHAPRPAPPARDPALLRVAGFNLLNFFNGDGQGGGFPTERGAGSRVDQFRQRDKLVAAMTALDADVFGVMEIENDGYDRHSAIAELAQAMSDAHAARHGGNPDLKPVYSAIDPGAPRLGEDVIAVGLIYRNDRVRPVDAARYLDTGPFQSRSRAPLAQAFTALDAGSDRAFLVVVNHFKSKRCSDASGDQVDRGDGESCYGRLRLDSARLLLEWLDREIPPYRTANSLVIGDLNSHSREPPVQAFVQRGLVDLPARFGGAAAPHTFVFRGQAGRLDHALAGSTLSARVRAAGTWAINADELPEFDYEGDARSGQRLFAVDPYRSSDHDPVWVDLEP